MADRSHHEGSGVPTSRITGWIDRQLRSAGRERTGPIVVRSDQPWATVYSASTSNGQVWLKVPGEGSRVEAGLYRLLLDLAPANILTPIAVDPEAGWLLLPDGGDPLAEVASGPGLIGAMLVALPQYAALQRAVAARIDDLLALGVPDLRPSVLADRFAAAVAGIASGSDRAELDRLGRALARWCARLAASPIPDSIDHNDLHPWNILGITRGPAAGPVTAVFYDWGDSVVANALCGSRVAISRARRLAGLAVDHPDVRRMRDAYLEGFTDLVDHRELVELVETAWRVAYAAQAVVWDGSDQAITTYLHDLRTGAPQI